MARINGHIVGKGHDFVAQRFEQVPGQIFTAEVGFYCQVGPAYVADKQRVAGKYGGRLTFFIAQQKTGRFHGMARRVQHLMLTLPTFIFSPSLATWAWKLG